MSERKLHQCTRHHNGVKAVVQREPDVVDMWIRFSTDFFPEAALFVDGECRSQGKLTTEECEAIATSLKRELNAAPQATMFEEEDI